MLRIFIAVLALVIPSSAALADPLQDALAAGRHGDYATELSILRPLADRGNPRAQFNVALMYARGLGAPQDFAEAVKWYRKAADQGDADAQYYLGFSYEKGEGVLADRIEAYKWVTLALESFPPTDAKNRAAANERRNGIAAKMTPAEISEAQRLARAWKPTK